MFKLVAIRDIKADLWFNPQCTPSLGGSIRDFGDACGNKRDNNPLAEHPEDYELYDLGEWDETQGQFHLHDKPKQLAAGGNYKKA